MSPEIITYLIYAGFAVGGMLLRPYLSKLPIPSLTPPAPSMPPQPTPAPMPGGELKIGNGLLLSLLLSALNAKPPTPIEPAAPSPSTSPTVPPPTQPPTPTPADQTALKALINSILDERQQQPV